MSREAVDLVKTYSHPKVKGATRRCLDVIAEQIPEGATMTPPLSIPELTTLMDYGDQAARRSLAILVHTAGVIRVVEGGQGKVGSFELLILPGALGADPSLPLIGATPAPRTRRPRPTTTAPDLFTEPADASPTSPSDQTTKNSGDFVRRWVSNLVHFVRSFVSRVVNIGDFVRRWRSNSGDFVRRLHPLDVDDARARATVVERSKYEEEEDARAREAEEFLDWFAAEYPSFHQGARCTIARAADGGRITELLRWGRTIERLKAITLVLWRLTTDGVLGSERWYIAERAPVRNIWLLHRKADFLDIELTRLAAPVVTASEANVWTRVLERLESGAVARSEFHTWFRATVLIEDRGDEIDVAKPGDQSDVVADWLSKHYDGVVREALEAERPGTRVRFVVVREPRRKFG